MLESIVSGTIAGLLAGIISSFFGIRYATYLSEKQNKIKEDKLLANYHTEIDLIIYKHGQWLKQLIVELKSPMADRFGKPVEIDFDIVNFYHRNLIGVLNSEHRKLISWLELMSNVLKNNSNTRFDGKVDSSLLYLPTHHTSILIVDVCKVIYFLSKSMVNHKTFIFDNSFSNIEICRLACEFTNIEFEDSWFSSVVNEYQEKHF